MLEPTFVTDIFVDMEQSPAVTALLESSGQFFLFVLTSFGDALSHLLGWLLSHLIDQKVFDYEKQHLIK